MIKAMTNRSSRLTFVYEQNYLFMILLESLTINTKIKLSLFRFYFNWPTEIFIHLCLSGTLQLMAGKSAEQPSDVSDS